MNYLVHEFLSYLFIVVMCFYTWWGWSLFDQLTDVEHQWARWFWLGGMIVMLVIFALFTVL